MNAGSRRKAWWRQCLTRLNVSWITSSTEIWWTHCHKSSTAQLTVLCMFFSAESLSRLHCVQEKSGTSAAILNFQVSQGSVATLVRWDESLSCTFHYAEVCCCYSRTVMHEVGLCHRRRCHHSRQCRTACQYGCNSFWLPLVLMATLHISGILYLRNIM